MPVRDVTVSDAHGFAKWLGGRLPSPVQWDKAAGRYHRLQGLDPFLEGPYQGKWNDNKNLRIAVGGLDTPRPIGSVDTEDDKSIYGCRDMAGNGREWTRLTRESGDVPIPLEQRVGELEEDVYLRGWSFEEKAPLCFDEIDKLDGQRHYAVWGYKDTAPDLSFRVVLEPQG